MTTKEEFRRSLVTTIVLLGALAVIFYFVPKASFEPLCQCQPCVTGDAREGRNP